jgi:hypothetical protein
LNGDFISCTFAESVYHIQGFMLETLEFFKNKITCIFTPANKDNMTSSFLICITEVVFSCLIALARKLRNTLNKRGGGNTSAFFGRIFDYFLTSLSFITLFILHCLLLLPIF